MEKLYTVKDVAEKLSIGYRKVLDLIAFGEIKAYKIGSEYRISAGSLFDYLESAVYKSNWKN